MKASPLAVFLTILIVLFAVIPGVFIIFFPVRGVDGFSPTGSFTGFQKVGDSTENVFFGPFSRVVNPVDIKILVLNLSSTGFAYYTMPPTGSSGPLTLAQSNNASAQRYLSGISGVTYTDLDQNWRISDGDYISMEFAYSSSESVTYQVGMLYVPTGAEINRITFAW
jgi:hypothetical protein